MLNFVLYILPPLQRKSNDSRGKSMETQSGIVVARAGGGTETNNQWAGGFCWVRNANWKFSRNHSIGRQLLKIVLIVLSGSSKLFLVIATMSPEGIFHVTRFTVMMTPRDTLSKTHWIVHLKWVNYMIIYASLSCKKPVMFLEMFLKIILTKC